MCQTVPSVSLLPFEIVQTEYNKESGLRSIFEVCIAYYIWDWLPNPTSNYVCSTDGKELHAHTSAHMQQESVIV